MKPGFRVEEFPTLDMDRLKTPFYCLDCPEQVNIDTATVYFEHITKFPMHG